MPLELTPMRLAPTEGRAVFVSASIPDETRWDGPFDPLGIVDAVVSAARTFLTEGYRLVTAAHPTIAPLLLYVAAEFPRSTAEQVVIYQSALFRNELPAATQRFRDEGVGVFVLTPAAEGDRPQPGSWDASLETMRRQMFVETDPLAALFVGGMQGISLEHSLYLDMFPGRPTYALGGPGGEARLLPRDLPAELAERLASDDVYPAVWRAVIEDLDARRR